MSLAGVIVILALVAAILAIARSWPRPSPQRKRPRSDPQPKPRVPGAPYRAVADPDDDAAEPDDEFFDPVVPLHERELYMTMLRSYTEAVPVRDGRTMVDAAKRVLARTKTPALRARALRILAHGHALNGAEAAALSALEAVPADHETKDDLEIQVLALARRYDAALQRAREAVEEEPSAEARTLLARVEKEAHLWTEACSALANPAHIDLLEPETFALVRDAGRLEGKFDAAARAGERLFERTPDPDLAYEIARCWARARDTERAALWLERAATAGFRDAERVEASSDLQPLRGAPSFQRALRAVRGD